jgi:hypothetical protein
VGSRTRAGVRSWLVALALAAPLALILGWLLHGALTPPPRAEAAAGAEERTSLPSSVGVPPTLDLPAGRLEERVDGGADALRSAGCTRLLYWRSEAPAADVEALVFDSVEHARVALAREAGNERTPGPGDEAQVSAAAVYSRYGAVVVRAFADPGAGDSAALVAVVRRLEPRLARTDTPKDERLR